MQSTEAVARGEGRSAPPAPNGAHRSQAPKPWLSLALLGFCWLFAGRRVGFPWLSARADLGFCWLFRTPTLAFVGFLEAPRRSERSTKYRGAHVHSPPFTIEIHKSKQRGRRAQAHAARGPIRVTEVKEQKSNFVNNGGVDQQRPRASRHTPACSGHFRSHGLTRNRRVRNSAETRGASKRGMLWPRGKRSERRSRRAAARKPAAKAPSRKAASKKPARKAVTRKAAARKAPAPKLPPRWSAAQRSEFAAIQSRAKALSAGLKRADFDSEGDPLPGPWASMLADLDAWARKYKVKLEMHEHDHAPAAGASVGAPAGGATPIAAYGGDCPGSFTKTERKKVYGTDYIYNYSCTLKRQTLLGRCVYNCALDYTLAS